jgi:hypothetical protein
MKHNKVDELGPIISHMIAQSKTSELRFVSLLASFVYDKDKHLASQLYAKLKEIDVAITPALYNYFLWNAIQFKNYEQTM